MKKKITEDVLTNNTIDWYEAKYWCLFNDKIFESFINTLKNKEVTEDDDEEKKPMTKEQWAALQNSFNHQDIIDKSKKKEKSFSAGDTIKQYNKTSARHIGSPIPGGHLGSRDNQERISGVSTDTEYPIDDLEMPWWLKDIIDYVKGVFEKFKSIIPISLISMAIYALYQTREIWFPKVQLLFRRLMAGNCLAKMTFSTDEYNYILAYDLRKNGWTLDYKGFKSSFLNNNYKPSSEEVQQLMEQTNIKKFTERCYQLTKKNLTDKKTLSYLAALTSDKKLPSKFKKIIEDLIKNSKRILINMENQKIAY